MGFHQDGYATVWSIEPRGKFTKVRLSTSHKNKKTNKLEQDFSGYVSFVGPANEAVQKLRERDKIKILSCDVTTNYDAIKKREYINYTIFDFEKADGSSGTATATAAAPTRSRVAPIAQQADESDTATTEDDNLPF